MKLAALQSGRFVAMGANVIFMGADHGYDTPRIREGGRSRFATVVSIPSLASGSPRLPAGPNEQVASECQFGLQPAADNKRVVTGTR